MCVVCLGMPLCGDTFLKLSLFRFGLIVFWFIPTMKSTVHTVYHLLPCRANTSLKQFWVDLTCCLWFVGCFIKRLISPGKSCVCVCVCVCVCLCVWASPQSSSLPPQTCIQTCPYVSPRLFSSLTLM